MRILINFRLNSPKIRKFEEISKCQKQLDFHVLSPKDLALSTETFRKKKLFENNYEIITFFRNFGEKFRQNCQKGSLRFHRNNMGFKKTTASSLRNIKLQREKIMKIFNS